jgi:hypothetical protein
MRIILRSVAVFAETTPESLDHDDARRCGVGPQGSGSINWAATRIVCDPLSALRDGWGAEVEEDPIWGEAFDDGLDKDLEGVTSLLDADTLAEIESGDDGWEPRGDE